MTTCCYVCAEACSQEDVQGGACNVIHSSTEQSHARQWIEWVAISLMFTCVHPALSRIVLMSGSPQKLRCSYWVGGLLTYCLPSPFRLQGASAQAQASRPNRFQLQQTCFVRAVHAPFIRQHAGFSRGHENSQARRHPPQAYIADGTAPASAQSSDRAQGAERLGLL